MFWKVSGSEGTRAAKGTPRGRAVGPGVVLEAEKGFGLDQLRASKERVLPPTAENLRRQLLRLGEMQEDGNIGLDCSLFSILVAFRASSNLSTSAPGCQAEKFEAKGSGREAKMARAILFNERILNNPDHN